MTDKTAGRRVSPGFLWMQAHDEVLSRHHFASVEETTRDHRDEIRVRYLELMCEHGHLVERKPGDDPNLPCGWPGEVRDV